MSYVISIDVGLKNLGLCVFDFSTAQIVHWENVLLIGEGSYAPKDNVKYVRDFVSKYRHFFDHAFQVVIERQIRTNMRIVEAVLHTLFYDVCKIVSARTVKCHFNLSCKNYRQNKQKAVQVVRQFTRGNPSLFMSHLREIPFARGKVDDLADSLLLLLYYLDTYSNQIQYQFCNVLL